MRPALFKLPLIILSALLFLIGLAQARHSVQSPDGRLIVELSTDKKSEQNSNGFNPLTYSIRYDNHSVIEHSDCYLELKNGHTIGKLCSLISVRRSKVKTTRELHYGKNKQISEYYYQGRFLFKTGKNSNYLAELIVRVYNDAAAIRWHLPVQTGQHALKIKDEHLSVRLENNADVFALPLANFQTPYENKYTNDMLTELPSGQLFGLPFLMQLKNGLWLAIAEADLSDYAGMYLTRSESAQQTLLSRLAPLPNDSSYAADIQRPASLPWRVFWMAEHPGRFIESDVILSLAQTTRIEAPQWIKPGKVVWPWWTNRVVRGREFEGGMNTETMKYYIDFAAEMGIEYLLIDAEWYGKHDTADEDITTTIPEIDMPAIIRYAKQNGVGVWLWLNWQCVRDQMDRAFPLYEQWGIKGLKVDYMNRDDQQMVQFYRRVVEKAAQHHLMINFHGAFKPTGLRRTFPNLLTREGLLGLEYSKWSEACNPEHDLILPYTRMLAGPMDYTPGAFRVASEETFEARFTAPMAMGTRAHQLAMYVVFESPLQMLVDYPAAYFGKRGTDFLRHVPVVWDETRFIEGEVGDYIALARRQGKEWYLGTMTDWSQRSLEIPLQFLDDNNYYAFTYMDDIKDYGSVKTQRRLVNKNDVLKVEMDEGGGCAIRFVPTW